MSHRQSNRGDNTPGIKILKIVRKTGKKITAIVSRNGGKPQMLLFEKTKGGWHDQFGHQYNSELAIS